MNTDVDMGTERTGTVCALIVHYGNVAPTLHCIASLSGQVEHVVIVDNSEEKAGTQKLRDTLADHVEGRSPPGATLLVAGQNLGFARAVNYGLSHGGVEKYEACLLINNDAQATPGMVGRLMEAIHAYKGSAVAAPCSVGGGASAMLWYQRSTALVTRIRLPGSFPYLTGACILLPATLATPPLFNEKFFMYGEDAELSWRLRRCGVRLCVVSSAVLQHEGSGSSVKGSKFYEYHTARSHLLLGEELSRDPGNSRGISMVLRFFLMTRAIKRSILQLDFSPLRAYRNALNDVRESR